MAGLWANWTLEHFGERLLLNAIKPAKMHQVDEDDFWRVLN
jgi:hypothetical protein